MEPEQINLLVPEMNKDAKGMLVQYEAKMLLEGYGAETISGSVGCLRALQETLTSQIPNQLKKRWQ